jgi:hypothetical protein
MQFLKKNYEKIVLGVVVLATLGIVACLPFLVSGESKKLDALESDVTIRVPKPLEPLVLTNVDDFISRSKTTVSLNLESPHRIFNPVRWQLKNGKPFKNPAGEEIKALTVTKITPLYEIYSLQTVAASEGVPTHYGIGIKHEGAASVSARTNPKITWAAMNQTTNNFTVVAAEGPEGDPTSVTLKLSDTGQRVTITKEKPYQRPEAYMADLVYTPENKPFLNRRKTDTGSISFANEYYKIVDITESEVVLLQLSNQKTWIKDYHPTNSAAPTTSP